jgi:hypothetical protein
MSGQQRMIISGQVAADRTTEPNILEFVAPQPLVATSEWFARASRYAAEAVAVAERAHREKMQRRLDKPSRGWTTVEVVRTYRANADGERQFREEADVMTRHGYVAWLETDRDGPRLGGRLLVSTGLGIATGRNGRRGSGRRTVTWARAAGDSRRNAASASQ